MKKIISISLSPNTEADDTRLAFGLLTAPWQWKRGEAIGKFEQEFKQYLGVKYAYSFNSGRSSLMAILDALALPHGSEVLLQAFTCNAVPNPVLWTGHTPVYVDCDEASQNMDIEDLRRKITPKSKAVIVQHTFGLPADIAAIAQICREHHLFLIEDCAHALGARVRGKLVGTFGDAALFSFSRDKVISCVYGGMAVTNDDTIARRVREFQERAGYPSRPWILQQILHPIVMNWIVLPTYPKFGKYVLRFLQSIRVLSKAVHWKEKRGMIPGYFPKRLPAGLAILARKQFSKLERFNAHRKEIALYYARELEGLALGLPPMGSDREHIFLRYPIRHEHAREIIRSAWKRHLLIGDWYTYPIAPADTRLYKMGYQKGSCPVAERLARTTFNLPTHMNCSVRDAEQIVQFLKAV